MSYTLDTSAILAYLLNEAGADEVRHILEAGEKGQLDVLASFMTFMEFLYRTWKLSGEAQAKRAYLMLRALPIREVPADESLLVTAARLKANHTMSVADAWIAATAVVTDSVLVHKDPEMDCLPLSIKRKALPYK
jgi:predicted nucleic acid-binding protein